MSAELARESGPAHCDSEPVVDVELLAYKVDTLEATKHVVDWHETCPVLIHLSLNVEESVAFTIFSDAQLGLSASAELRTIRVDVEHKQVLLSVALEVKQV